MNTFYNFTKSFCCFLLLSELPFIFNITLQEIGKIRFCILDRNFRIHVSQPVCQYPYLTGTENACQAMYHGKVCFKDNETFCWRVWNAWLELFCAGDYSFSRKPVSSLCFTCLCLFLLGMVKDGTRLIGNGLSCCQKLLFFYGSQHACPNILTDAKHGVCYSDNTKVAWPGHDDISD